MAYRVGHLNYTAYNRKSMEAAFKNWRDFIKLGVLYATLLLALASCSPSKPSKGEKGLVTNYTKCLLPDDQGNGSFRASWANLPIRVVLDKDFYMTDEGQQAEAIKGAINTWNAWGAIRGFTVFSLVEDGSGINGGRLIPDFEDSEGCEPPMFTAAATDGVVGIWKLRPGGRGRINRGSCGRILDEGIQGYTDWEVVDGHTTKASILLNFADFNTPGKRLLDLESLALHELGHVIGLLHSCKTEESDGTSSPLCSDAPRKYLEAVMFPVLGDAQLRRKLRQNDYDRVNCLY